MYVCAVYGGALVVFGIGRLVFSFTTEMELVMAVLLLVVSWVVPGGWGNAWLHADCRRRMAQALQQSSTLPQACDQLRTQSSSRSRFLNVVAITITLLSVGLGFYVKRDGGVERKETLPRSVIEPPHVSQPWPINDLKSPASI